MRVTIIPSDKQVVIGGEGRIVDPFPEIDPNIHAVQWYGDHGYVEVKVGSQYRIEGLAPFQACVDAWSAWTPPPVPEPPPDTRTPQEKRAARYRREADPFLLARTGYLLELEDETDPVKILALQTKAATAKADYKAAKALIRSEVPD